MQVAQDNPVDEDPFMAEVPDFQPDPNEITICLVLQHKERKELARIRKEERKATIKKYRQDL